MTDLALAAQQESGGQVTERVRVDQEPRVGRQEMLEAARAFIERGYHLTLLYGTTAEGVCECRLGPRCKSAGKHPQERGWSTRPISTAADLAARWERKGGTPNIGVMPDDGLVVIDVDRKNGKRGAESLAALEAELGPLGEPHQTTASGGLHYVFRVPPETDAASLPNRTDVAEGIDILRVGRQFVAAPSQIGTRRYAGYLPPRDELPVLPPAWVSNLQAHGGDATANQATTDPRVLEERLAALKAPSVEKVREVVACIPNVPETDRSKYVWIAHAIKGACGGEATGEGLDIFTAWAGEWPGSVDPVEDERVFVTIRRENVHTGWPDLLRLAEQHAYDSSADRLAELHADFSALARPEAAAGDAPSSTAAVPHELHDLLVALHEYLKTNHDALRRESIRDEWLARIHQKLRIPFGVLRERLAAFDAPHRQYKPRIVRPGRELRDAMSQAPRQALVPQYIYAEMQHVLYGTPQSLKTFTALDLGLHIASGLPWLGRVPVIQRGVVFFAGEAATSLWVRIAAWCSARGIQVEAAADLPFALIDAVPTLGRGDDGLQDAIARVEEAMRPFTVPIGLVVLDNMTRMAAASGLSTTDTGQYGSILAGIDALGRATKAGTLTIYHVPVSDQSRPAGTYQTTANPDVIIRAERPDATEPRIILRMAPPHGKSRGGPPAPDLALPFKVQGVVPWLTSSFEREGRSLPATLESAAADDFTCTAPSADGSAGIVLPKTPDSMVSEALRQQFTSLVVDVEAIAKSAPAGRSFEVTKEDADVRLVLEACEICPGASGQALRAACGGRGKDIDAAAFTAIKGGLAEDRRRSSGAHDYHLTDAGREWLKAARARDVDEATDTAAALAALDQPA